jgi:hypothetical protein
MTLQPKPATLNETLQLIEEAGDDTVLVQVVVPSATDTQSAVLALWSCWWGRWIGTLDCSFSWCQEFWLAEVRLPADKRNLLTAVLKDLLSIKNAICLFT